MNYDFNSAEVFNEKATQTVNTLRIDSRGRVRFTSQGTRFEITKNGLNAYSRDSFSEFPAFFNINRISNETLLKITEAVNLVNA
jgi:hypothetical protein